jgi:hypothetical protein
VLIGDDVFCAFGSTIKKAGSKERFRQIDTHRLSRESQGATAPDIFLW